MKLFGFLRQLWDNRQLVKSVSSIVIKLIDSIDGEIDFRPVDESKK